MSVGLARRGYGEDTCGAGKTRDKVLVDITWWEAQVAQREGEVGRLDEDSKRQASGVEVLSDAHVRVFGASRTAEKEEGKFVNRMVLPASTNVWKIATLPEITAVVRIRIMRMMRLASRHCAFCEKRHAEM
jgi:hypothetical protein